MEMKTVGRVDNFRESAHSAASRHAGDESRDGSMSVNHVISRKLNFTRNLTGCVHHIGYIERIT
jgi:hypothetical protein